MKSCPNGAILRHHELALLSEALEWAIDSVEVILDSGHYPNPADAPRGEIRLERTRQRLLRQFKRMRKDFERTGNNAVKIASRMPPGVEGLELRPRKRGAA